MKAATDNTLPVNATPRWLPVRPKKTVPVPNAAENINPASASRNINILLPTVLIRVRYRGTAAADNIPTASVRPELTKGRTAAPNIILLHVPRSARWPTPTTAISAARSFQAVRATPVVLIFLIVRIKSVLGAAIPVIYSQETAA